MKPGYALAALFVAHLILASLVVSPGVLFGGEPIASLDYSLHFARVWATDTIPEVYGDVEIIDPPTRTRTTPSAASCSSSPSFFRRSGGFQYRAIGVPISCRGGAMTCSRIMGSPYGGRSRMRWDFGKSGMSVPTRR